MNALNQRKSAKPLVPMHIIKQDVYYPGIIPIGPFIGIKRCMQKELLQIWMGLNPRDTRLQSMTIIKPFSDLLFPMDGEFIILNSNALLMMNASNQKSKPSSENMNTYPSLPFTGLPKTFEVLSRFARLFQRERCGLRTITWSTRTLTDSLCSLNHWGWRLCRHRMLQRENRGL